jgi:hypothetical protein
MALFRRGGRPRRLVSLLRNTFPAAGASSEDRRHEQLFALAATVLNAWTRRVEILPFSHSSHDQINHLAPVLLLRRFLPWAQTRAELALSRADIATIIAEPTAMTTSSSIRPTWSYTWGSNRIRNDQNAKIPIVTATE